MSLSKDQWKYYKENNLKLIWRNSTVGWCKNLRFKLPLIEFLNKFSPDKIHYKLQKLRFIFNKKPIMPTLEYVITTRCTMNCKNCNTFVPYFSNETHKKNTTFEEFKKDLDILLKAVDYIDYFGFVGGEPLLVPDLAKMVKYATAKKKIRHLFLASNCTILPSDELAKALSHPKVVVQLSDYRNSKNMPENLTIKYQEYQEILKKHNVRFYLPADGADGETGFLPMPKLYPDTQNPKEMKSLFNSCWGQYCNMLCDGILTQCTLSVFISRNLELTEDVKKELVNIRENKSSKQLSEEIIKFYAKPYSAFCNYCHDVQYDFTAPIGEQL